jgi:Cu(I)/Ag(I) efflux system membrane protein CusA/SilA
MLLQQTDRLIKTVPEVESVFGKAGRADSATDPAPLEMFETTIRFKPRDQWRAGMTPEKLRDELEARVKVPGLANFWIPPIRNRIDMLATGIKSPIGIKVAGSNLDEIDRTAIASRSGERPSRRFLGLAERLTGGRYIDVDVNRVVAGRYGLNVADVQAVVSGAIGGESIGQTVEGLARYPISVRYPRELRDSVDKLANLPVLTPSRQQITLGTVGNRPHQRRPADAAQRERPAGHLDLRRRARRDMAGLVGDINRAIASKVAPPPGVSISYTGQYEFLVRAKEAYEARHPGDARDHLRAALPDLPPLGRGAADHGHAALRADRRAVAALVAGLQPVGRNRGRVHRARRRRRRVRRGHADLPQSRRSRRGATAMLPPRCAKARCCACGPRR